MTIRPWSPQRQVSALTWFCDRCTLPFHPPLREYTVCPDCAPGDKLAVPLMNNAEVQAAAKRACDTKPHDRPARRRAA